MPELGTEPASGAISFQVLAEVAVGATARVDLCRALPPHPRKGQLIAVKRLHPHIAEDPGFANQFLDEVWMTASLRHPNVVEVAGWGTDEQGGYLAVELVQGVSLLRLMKTVFETGEVFSERMVVYIASRICRGLGAAHALRAPNGELLNLVHRDLTPGNILVGFNGDLKIADFGLAKAKQRLTKTLTGMRKGEPTYMAPEQAATDDIDQRADIFSLGVMLFELFAGRRPWIAKSDFEMVQVTAREPPADLREIRPKIDKELVLVVNRCLEKDPAARYQSAGEIADRFDEWLSVHGYTEGNEEALARFVRRNAMRQMRWFERAVSGELAPKKVGRDLPPRVPTYTEQTNKPAPAAPRAPDARQQRAANAVRELKKFAPPPPVPKPKPRTPTLDEDGEQTDVTDVEQQIASMQAQGGTARIVDHAADSDEDLETLVQKGSQEIQDLRAAARLKATARPASASTLNERGRQKPPYASLPIADEDSDQRITAVKREEHAKLVGRRAEIVAPDSEELPTAPINQATGRAAANAILPAGRARPGQEPARPRIPPSPGIPQFAGAARPKVPPPPPTPVDRPRRPGSSPITTRPPPPPSTAPPAPQPPAPPPPPQQPLAPNGMPPALTATSDPASSRASSPDDVIVIDRRELSGPMTEDALIVEADRLAIEAVRRNEEAKAAAIRAERKAIMAKMAGEAAMIATDAVKMIRTAGLQVAAARLDEARAIEAALQAGKFPVGSDPARSASSVYPGAAHGSMRPPEVSISQYPAPGSMPPPDRGAFIPPSPATPSGLVAASSAAALPPPPHAAGMPQGQPSMPPGHYPQPQPSLPPQPSPIVSSSADDELFRARLKPTILGMSTVAVAGLAGAAFAIVLLLLYFLFG